MEKITTILNKSLGVYNVRGMYVEPTYWEAAAIVFLLFLLVLTFARLRWLYIHWSFGKSSIAMIFWGFLLSLIFEGFLWIGGKTFLTEILGWKNPPKPISTALDLGRERLVGVLGAQSEIPMSAANEPQTFQSVLGNYSSLNEKDKEMVKSFICK